MTCPACRSLRVYPSRLRGLLERLRSRMTDSQPYRCHACGWRRWLPVDLTDAGSDVQPDDLRTARQPGPVRQQDLDPLDPP